MKQIIISIENISLSAQLNDSPTAQKIYSALPIEGIVNTWGDEIYFDIPVNIDQKLNARTDVKVGTLGYWPIGKAFCIFFGPTPASTDKNPGAYSPVNVFGEVMGDIKQLRDVKDGAKVRVDLSENKRAI